MPHPWRRLLRGRRWLAATAALGAVAGFAAAPGVAYADAPPADLGAVPGLAAAPGVAYADAAPADLGAVPGLAAAPGTAHADAPPVSGRVPSYVGALQPNAFYCGPAATRIALSAHGVLPSFDDLAVALGTTQAGTASVFEVTGVLNSIYGYARYTAVEMSNRTVGAKQVKKMRSDIISGVNQGDPIVANVKGTISDTAGEVHSYNGGHYVTITGYSSSGDLVTVTDPADAVGSNEYQVPIQVMATWVATRGYTY